MRFNLAVLPHKYSSQKSYLLILESFGGAFKKCEPRKQSTTFFQQRVLEKRCSSDSSTFLFFGNVQYVQYFSLNLMCACSCVGISLTACRPFFIRLTRHCFNGHFNNIVLPCRLRLVAAVKLASEEHCYRKLFTLLPSALKGVN